MRYDEVVTSILHLVRGAGDDNLRVFGAETVARLVREELLLDVAADDELDEDARLRSASPARTS